MRIAVKVKPSITLVIFDLDGTLVNAYTAIEKSINYTLKRVGYRKVSPARVRRSVGWGDVNFIRKFVDDDDAIRALRIYRRHHRRSLIRYSRLIPDTRKVLDALMRRGVALAIASNRPEKFTNILIDHLGIRRYFDVVRCGTNKDDIKPNPQLLLEVMRVLRAKKGQTLYVGDMVIDVQAAKNAGVKGIAVLGGSSSRAELQKARPYKIINKLAYIIPICVPLL